MRLHFFPALLPLASLLPWLLTGVGALAAGIQTLRKRASQRSIAVAFLLLLSGIGLILARQLSLPSEQQGSRLTPAADWPKLQTENAVSTHAPTPSTRWSELWDRLTPRKPLSAPTLAGPLLLVGTSDGTLEALDASSGAPLWSLKKGEPVLAAATVTSNRAYVGEGLHTAASSALTALSLPDGKPIWQREFLGHLESPPALSESTRRLWIGAGPRGLWSLDTQDGKVLWHKRIGHVDATPLLTDSLLIVPAQESPRNKETTLFALDPNSGETRWTAKLPGQPWGFPVTDIQQDLFVTTGVGQINSETAQRQGWSHALSHDGKLRWTIALPGLPLNRSVLFAKRGLIFHTLTSGELIAQRTRDGSIAWKVNVSRDLRTAPALITRGDQGLIATLDYAGQLSIRDALSGKEIKSTAVGQGSTSAPLFANGNLYVATPIGVTVFTGLPSLFTRGMR